MSSVCSPCITVVLCFEVDIVVSAFWLAVSHPSCSCGVRRSASTKYRLGVRQPIRSAIGIDTHTHHPTARAISIDRRALKRYERYRLSMRQPIRSATGIDTHIHQPTARAMSIDRHALQRCDRFRLGLRQPIRSAIGIDSH